MTDDKLNTVEYYRRALRIRARLIRSLRKHYDDPDKFAKELAKCEAIVSLSEGRRLFYQLGDK